MANAFDLVVRYSVGWKFVSVEDTFDTGQFCGTSEFTPKSGELSSLLIVGFGSKMPKEAFEGQCHHERTAGEAIGHHTGLCASKDL